MYCVPVGASRGLRWGCLSLAAVIALLAIASDPADARSRRKRHHVKKHQAAQSYRPPYAAIVVDANTGATLHQSHPDALRHPASLTKIMTLYLLFERLEAGRISLNTRLDVSEWAAAQAPTKLGLKPGETIAVEDAIKSLVTKSANDAAVVVAEALGGSEPEFARHMTRKARALGMRRTVYRNASGLPDDEQVTTARDQALLGLAIQERFPRQYKYFSTAKFVYRGHAMRNHNRLLGRVDGVDGIKTGYTRDSGFNLVTSMHRGSRHIVAVVLGGRTSRQRDARMRDLISTHIADASTGRTATKIADVPIPKPEPAPPSKPQLATASSKPLSLRPPPAGEATATIPNARPGSSAPIKPVRVKTYDVKLVPPRAKARKGSSTKRTEVEKPALVRVASAETAAPSAAPIPLPEPAASPAPPPGSRPGVLGVLPAMIGSAKAASAPAAMAEPEPARHTARRGWAIQIGAFEDEGEAKERLSSAKSLAASLLKTADPYTERTTKGEKTYYRARFAGFDHRNQAQAACRRLKRNDIVCMALKI